MTLAHKFDILSAYHSTRVLIIPDVHGCATALYRLIDRVGICSSDTVIFLGDMVNKGSDSLATLDLISKIGCVTRCILLRGNHEQMLLNEAQKIHSQLPKLCKYMHSADLLDPTSRRLKDDVLAVLQSTKLYCELPDGIAVHAGVNFSARHPFSDYKSMLWTHCAEVPQSYRPFRIICGHKSLSMAQIRKSHRSKASVLCLDNGCYMSSRTDMGRLICYDYTNDEILL